jgi:hypothetical protein
MNKKVADWEIEQECRLLEQEEENERYKTFTDEQWFAYRTVDFDQARQDVELFVRAGCDGTRLVADLRQLDGLPKITGPATLMKSFARRAKAFADEFESLALIFPGDVPERQRSIAASIVTTICISNGARG